MVAYLFGTLKSVVDELVLIGLIVLILIMEVALRRTGTRHCPYRRWARSVATLRRTGTRRCPYRRSNAGETYTRLAPLLT